MDRKRGSERNDGDVYDINVVFLILDLIRGIRSG